MVHGTRPLRHAWAVAVPQGGSRVCLRVGMLGELAFSAAGLSTWHFFWFFTQLRIRAQGFWRSLVRSHETRMATTDADLIADEGEFHSSYRIYLNALEMLAEPPENQCQLMGDYNVAWELKEDVLAGKYLVNRGYLSASQEAWVVAMASALETVSTLVLPAGPGREANLLAMQSPNWEPLRFLAAEVVRQLAPFTALNSSYLRLGNSSA